MPSPDHHGTMSMLLAINLWGTRTVLCIVIYNVLYIFYCSNVLSIGTICDAVDIR